MAIDTDINANPDLNEYSAEDYLELEKSVLGETTRVAAVDSSLFVVIVIILLIFGLAASLLILAEKWLS